MLLVQVRQENVRLKELGFWMFQSYDAKAGRIISQMGCYCIVAFQRSREPIRILTRAE
jgi:hypothetical protein